MEQEETAIIDRINQINQQIEELQLKIKIEKNIPQKIIYNREIDRLKLEKATVMRILYFSAGAIILILPILILILMRFL